MADFSSLSDDELLAIAAGDDLTARQMQAESNFDPYAVSSAGAQGLMQIMPDTARQPGYGVTPLQGWDGQNPMTAPAEEQIRFGQDYRNAMASRYGDENLGLAAYNAGPGTVDQYLAGERQLPQETVGYVDKLGGQSDFSGLSDEELMAAAGMETPQPNTVAALQQEFEAKKAKPGLARTIFDQGLQGATFGFSDELTDKLGAAIAATVSPDLTLNQTYNQARAMTRESQANQLQERPVASILSNIAGGLVTGGAANTTKAGAAITNSLGRGSLGARVAKAGLAGSTSGGLYGYGSGNDGERNQSAALGAAFGGIIGGAMPLAGAGLKSLNEKLGTTVRATQPELKKSAQASYKLAEEKGGVLAPSFTDDFIDYAQSFGPKDKMATTIGGDSPVAQIGKQLEDFRGERMTLDRASAVDQALTAKLDEPQFTDKNGVLNAAGRELLEVKNRLRDQLTNAVDNELVEGGTEGITAYRKAVKDWSAQSQLGEIQRIVDRASYMDNPATALKTGFRAIAVNPGRLSKFPPEVQKQIKNAARDGDISNILRTELGSRLISTIAGGLAGSAAGPLGTLAGTAVGFAGSRGARMGAEALQMGRVNKVVDAIAEGSSRPTVKTPLVTKDTLQKQFQKRKTK